VSFLGNPRKPGEAGLSASGIAAGIIAAFFQAKSLEVTGC